VLFSLGASSRFFFHCLTPEGGEEVTVILQNIWIYTPNNTVSHPRRLECLIARYFHLHVQYFCQPHPCHSSLLRIPSFVQLSSEPEALQELEWEEWVKEVRLVPQDYWEEEPVVRIEHRTVLEDRHVLQVCSSYPFTGQGVTMEKGEVMLLLDKTNSDWWNVRKADGTDGFVPATYVHEMEPKVVQVQVRRPEKIREIQRVKKTRMVKQFVPTRRARPVKPAGECVVRWES
jgi:hypothetical protein